MARKYELSCDKCGQPIVSKNVRTVNVRDYSAVIQFWDIGRPRDMCAASRIDLCPTCAERFVNWLESEI